MIKQKDLIYNTDWDLLIVIDDCRFDYFKEVNWLRGTLQPVWSEGSSTAVWFSRTFDRPIGASIVSGHPFFSPVNPRKLSFNAFNSTHYVRRGMPIKKRGIEMGLCPAEYNTDLALGLDEERLIIHYSQPHFPALGEPKLLYSGRMIYRMVKRGELDMDFVKEAYKGNIRYVLREAERLIRKRNTDGKVIVTSDHGELFGEYGLYSHPPHMICRELRVIPWLEVEA